MINKKTVEKKIQDEEKLVKDKVQSVEKAVEKEIKDDEAKVVAEEKTILDKIKGFFSGIKTAFKSGQYKKYFWLFAAGFFIYMGIEVLFTGLFGGMVGFKDKVYFTFGGYSSFWMGVVGGLLLIVLGLLNGIKKVKNLSLFWQSIIGTFIILLTEFVSGCILNLALGLHVWDYSHIWLNVAGQINLFYAVFWFFLCPFAFWADDTLRWVFYKTGICQEAETVYNLKDYYKQLFTFKPVAFVSTTGKKSVKK